VNLEQAIHQHWAATEELEALLPAENVKTGRSRGGPMPYATIERTKGRPDLHTNAGDALDEITILVHVWHDNYDDARAIAEQVKAAFDRSVLSLSEGGDVARLQRTSDTAVGHDDGVWRMTVELLARVYLSWD
jgi:hypothetical protein